MQGHREAMGSPSLLVELSTVLYHQLHGAGPLPGAPIIGARLTQLNSFDKHRSKSRIVERLQERDPLLNRRPYLGLDELADGGQVLALLLAQSRESVSLCKAVVDGSIDSDAAATRWQVGR
jgi:hypothetical protein